MKRVLFLLSVAVIALTADTALGCTCDAPQSPAQELKRATAVFSGKVVKIKRDKKVADIFARVEAVFKVKRVWKGVEQETISVFTSSISTACGYGFKKGITYLVYAYGNEEGKLYTSICSRTDRFEDWHEDMEELGPGKVITKSRSSDSSVKFTNASQVVATQFPQRVSEKYCRRIEAAVIRPLSLKSMDTRIVFSDECWFDFTTAGKIDVLLSVQKHSSHQEAHDSMQRYLLMVAVGFGLENEKDLPLDEFETNVWEEVYFNKAGKMNSGFLLLRKGNIEINVLSLSDELIIKAEKQLRELVLKGLL